MVPMVRSDPIDWADRSNEIINGLRITGGNNCLCLTRCKSITIRDCWLELPTGRPGDSRHCLCLNQCEDITVERLHCVMAGSDAVNAWNCLGVVLGWLEIEGDRFRGGEVNNPQNDIGQDVVIDGTAMQCERVHIANSKLRSLIVAAGKGHTLGPALTISEAIQIGGAYGKNVSREAEITARLGGVSSPLLYVHSHVKLVEFTPACRFGRIDAAGRNVRGVSNAAA